MRALPLLAALCALPISAAEPAEWVARGGDVYTADAARSWADAIAVRGGRIVYVGDDAGVRPFMGPRTEVVELGGRLLLPGFVDAHAHPIAGGLQLLSCDLSDLASAAEVIAQVARCAKARPDAAWITGGGWGLPLFPDANPRREQLDEIVPDRPVALTAADGHSLWVNSKALALAGIGRTTPDPAHGRIERDPKTGEPTGTLREAAAETVWARVPRPSAAERAAALERALADAHRFGITSWLDASAGPDDLAAYRDVDGRRKLGVFVRAALPVDPRRGAEQVRELAALRARDWGPRVAPGAAKLFADGVIEAGTAALLEPYLRRDGSRGELVFSPEQLRALALALDAEGFQLHVHAIGDRAVRASLDAIEHLVRERGARDRRAAIAHLELVHPDDVARFRRLRVVADLQPLWALEDRYVRELTVPFLGPERARRLYPIGSLAASGAPLAAGSDWPVTSMNPLEAIEVALTRRDPREGAGPAWLPEQRSDLATLVAAYTIGGAWALFRERETGSIEVGKSADLVLLDRNLFALRPHEISEARVLRTWFEGQEVHRAD